MKRNKSIKMITFICLIIGFVFLFASFFNYVYVHDFVKNGEETTATIISITTSGNDEDERHIVEVEYLVNDVKYITSLGHYDSEMIEGRTVPIIYLPDNPYKIIYGENTYMTFWMFFVVGASFSIIGLVLLIVLKKRVKNVSLDDEKAQISVVETKKMATRNYMLLSIPVVGAFYAMFRMLFLISEHFDSTWSIFGKRFWKFWSSCTLIMVVSLFVSSPLYIAAYLILPLNNRALFTVFILLFFILWGYSVYFITNYVIRATKSINN